MSSTVLCTGHPHVDGKFTAHPHKLCRVEGHFRKTGDVGFQRIDGMCPHKVYRFEIFLEHVGMLIIFGGYVLFDSGGHGDSIGPSERQEENVSDRHISWKVLAALIVLTTPCCLMHVAITAQVY